MKIEIAEYRDPDSSTVLVLFIDGVEVPFEHYSIDPGAGHLLSSWREYRDECLASASSDAVRGLLTEWFDDAEESPYIEDDLPDEEG